MEENFHGKGGLQRSYHAAKFSKPVEPTELDKKATDDGWGGIGGEGFQRGRSGRPRNRGGIGGLSWCDREAENSPQEPGFRGAVLQAAELAGWKNGIGGVPTGKKWTERPKKRIPGGGGIY